MATQRHLTILLALILFTYSLLLPAGAVRDCEAANRLGTSSMSTGWLHSDLKDSVPVARIAREPDKLLDRVTNDHYQGRAPRPDRNRRVKDCDSAKGLVHTLDAGARQTADANQVQLCEYTVVIRTGNLDGAGTEADIRLLLSNKAGEQVYFQYLANGHRAFKKGHRDTFVFPDQPCLPGGVCEMVLYTDDYGPFSEWFVVSLQLKVAIPDAQKPGTERVLQEKAWGINEWLPKVDGSEELYTIRDDCNKTFVN